ncbi:MAG: PilN domain-containing protein [Oligoflexia bacterium]|nr:PilN domain-containing protein [Oligoflexia bacterium]
MIKVNLLRDISEIAAPKKRFTFGSSPSASAEVSASEGGLAIRLVLFILPIVFAFGYQKYQKMLSDADLRNLQSEHEALQAKLKSLDPVISEVERFQEEKRKLNSQLEVIKQLSKERLKNVKSLDMLQTIIPPKAWLTSLKVIDKKVEMEGMAVDDIVISEFMQAMSTTIYFSNVTLIGSEEFKQQDGAVKKFKIKCNLENL